MGIDDRDYMRERYRARARNTKWNDRAGRVEGAWFNSSRSHVSQRSRPGGSHPRTGLSLRWLPFALSLLLTGIPAYHALKREGWLPDRRPELPFPESGAVTISPGVTARRATARLTVRASSANAVVQLFDAESGRHVISVYVRKNDQATIPVPPGVFRVKIAEGQRWHGPKRFFGYFTAYETVAQDLIFSPEQGHGLDLNRRPDGNLPARPNWRAPEPL